MLLRPFISLRNAENVDRVVHEAEPQSSGVPKNACEAFLVAAVIPIMAGYGS